MWLRSSTLVLDVGQLQSVFRHLLLHGQSLCGFFVSKDLIVIFFNFQWISTTVHSSSSLNEQPRWSNLPQHIPTARGLGLSPVLLPPPVACIDTAIPLA